MANLSRRALFTHLRSYALYMPVTEQNKQNNIKNSCMSHTRSLHKWSWKHIQWEKSHTDFKNCTKNIQFHFLKYFLKTISSYFPRNTILPIISLCRQLPGPQVWSNSKTTYYKPTRQLGINTASAVQSRKLQSLSEFQGSRAYSSLVSVKSVKKKKKLHSPRSLSTTLR